MHELSICASIADIATRHAAGRPVSVINVQVGQLRQIVPDTLVYCWGLVCEETSLAGSRIIVETVPSRIRCRSCERTADVGDLPVFACAGCGGIDVQIVAGEEFLITSLELVADAGRGRGTGDADADAGPGPGAGPGAETETETEAGAETGTGAGS